MLRLQVGDGPARSAQLSTLTPALPLRMPSLPDPDPDSAAPASAAPAVPPWTRPRWRAHAVFRLCLVAVMVLSLLPPGIEVPDTGWDKSNHLLGFGTLAVLGLLAHPGRARRLMPALLAYGGLIEVLQSFTGYRYAEWGDLLADGLGLLLGWAAMTLWIAVRRRLSAG